MRGLLFILLFYSTAVVGQVPDIQVDWQCRAELTACLTSLESTHSIRFAFKQDDLRGLSWDGPTGVMSLDSLLGLFQKRYQIEHTYIGDQIVLRRRPLRTHTFRVQDAETGEVIGNAWVWIPSQQRMYFTDVFGLVRAETRRPSLGMVIQRDGYHPFQGRVALDEETVHSIQLRPFLEFEGVVVRATDTGQVLPSRSYEEILPAQERIHSFGGEVDALSNLRLKGGILSVGLGEPGLAVRGGGPDQNLVTIDGIPVYNTYHILGLYSIFNSSTINSIKLYKDAFPAEYGGRLSSVVDVRLNDGDKDQLRADADVGIISSGFSANGPLAKDRLSFSVAGRRSHAQLLTIPAQDFLNQGQGRDNSTDLWYYDVFSKLHLRINDRHELKWTFYNGGDQFDYGAETDLLDQRQTTEISSGGLRWRNLLHGLQWHGVLHPKFFITAQTAWSNYQLEFTDAYRLDQQELSQGSSLATRSGLSEWRTTVDADWFVHPSHHLVFGTGAFAYQFQPFNQQYSAESPLGVTDTSINIAAVSSTEYYAYVEDRYFMPSGVLTAGVRYSRFVTEGKTYHTFQPRFFLTKNLNKRLQFRISLSDMAQFLHLLPNNNLGLPIDIWLPVTRDIPPLRSFQVSGGFRFRKGAWEGGLQLYAKNFRNLIELNQGSNFLIGGTQWKDHVVSGEGSASGVELLGSFKGKQWEMNGSYAYGRSIRLFNQINDYAQFYSKYDRPHNLNLFGRFELSNRTSLMVSFVYASGNPITLPISRYMTEIAGNPIIMEEFGERNNYRLPATHHLDIAFRTIHHFGRFHGEFVYGLYNIYNRLNPFMVYIGLDEELEPVLKLRSYLPVIPMLKYRLIL